MFGTDLHQAYDPGMNTEPHNLIHMNSSDLSREVEQKQASMQQPSAPSQPAHAQQVHRDEPVYETNNFFKDSQMNDQLGQLQEELKLQKQKLQATKSNDVNIIDRFVSKKKEVFKLVIISLTILLAFSMHFVVNDLMKTYLMNTILTPNQEMFTKLSYPITVLLLIWTIKVFNK